MKMKTIIKVSVGFILFGLALGLTFLLGDGIIDPIKEVIGGSGNHKYVRHTVIEVIGLRILQFVGVFLIWAIAVGLNKYIRYEINEGS